jgi:hypothetical protein
MSKYDMTITGSIDKMTVFLSDMTEKQITQFNTLGFLRNVENLSWGLLTDGKSEASGIFDFAVDVVSRESIKQVEKSYGVKVVSRKVNDEAVVTG